MKKLYLFTTIILIFIILIINNAIEPIHILFWIFPIITFIMFLTEINNENQKKSN